MSIYEKYGIYGIRNKINNKIYIGKTMMDFGDRRDCHIASLRGGYHINHHLQNAWDKYGEDCFEFCIIEDCTDKSAEQVNELEMLYISKYRDIDLAYNISDGGDGGANLGKHLSEDTKRKIGEKNKIYMTGRILSEDTRKKMSESQKKRYENWTEEDRIAFGKIMSENASGYSWSESSKQKFSEIQKTRPNGAKYDVETVRRIRYMHENEGKDFSSISDELGINRHTVYLIATYRRWKYVQ